MTVEVGSDNVKEIIPNMHFAIERNHMVLTQGEDIDVSHNNHLHIILVSHFMKTKENDR